MYAVSLTSIPPRFDRLAPVLQALLEQQPAPAQVFLCLVHAYRRFPGPVTLPALPDGVTLQHGTTDMGPATKALIAARHLAGTATPLLYCDDDWIMPPHWARHILAARKPGHAVAAAPYDVAQLNRAADPGLDQIAQGFAGVLIEPDWLSASDMAPPPTAWPVDDIWLSGQLARQGIRVIAAPAARRGARPAYDDAHALQRATPRAAANRRCADLLTARYGLWPPWGQRLSSTARAARSSNRPK